MIRYIIKRLLLMIPVVIGISIIIFTIVSLSPGDPIKLILGPKATAQEVAKLRQEMGLDKPLPIQYFNYVEKAVVHGDFGNSYKTKRPVINDFVVKFPITIKLAFFALIISIVVGIPVGVISALKPYSIFDKIFTVITFVLTSIPAFWLGLLLILLFSLYLGLLPSNGISGFKSYILPAFTNSSILIPYIARTTRSSFMEVLKEDYIRTARSKGAKNNTILTRHAMKNALIPVITASGIEFGYMLGGTVITETVFSVPGLGRYLITGIRDMDMPVVLGCCLILAITFCVVNFLVDILYAYLDPRIKAQYAKA